MPAWGPQLGEAEGAGRRRVRPHAPQHQRRRAARPRRATLHRVKRLQPTAMARHLPVVQMRSSIHEDGSHATVHPADVSGRFTTARNAWSSPRSSRCTRGPVAAGGRAPGGAPRHRAPALLPLRRGLQRPGRLDGVLPPLGHRLRAPRPHHRRGPRVVRLGVPADGVSRGGLPPHPAPHRGPREKRVRREAGDWTSTASGAAPSSGRCTSRSPPPSRTSSSGTSPRSGACGR
jgi:hypothetical protein